MNTPTPIASAGSSMRDENAPTPLELAQYQLHILKAHLASTTGEGKGTGNLYLLHYSIRSLEWEIAHMFDEETGEYLGDEGGHVWAPPMPAPIAPQDAQDLLGTFEFEGVELSRRRGPYGGHRIVARDALAHMCHNDTDFLVSKYGGSKRVYILMGHILDMIPWHYFPCAETGRNDGAILESPDVPLTEAEKDFWKTNWFRWHFHGGGLFGGRTWRDAAAQSNRMILNLVTEGRGIPTEGPWSTPIPGTVIYTVTNSPGLVMQEIRELVNDNTLIERSYRNARNTLERIDGGIWARIPGYRSPEDMGGSHSEEWYRSVGERESADNWPNFF